MAAVINLLSGYAHGGRVRQSRKVKPAAKRGSKVLEGACLISALNY